MMVMRIHSGVVGAFNSRIYAFVMLKVPIEFLLGGPTLTVDFDGGRLRHRAGALSTCLGTSLKRGITGSAPTEAPKSLWLSLDGSGSPWTVGHR
jgi:hypothetical protein